MAQSGSTAVDSNTQVKLAWRLVSRLERLSADSYWAHQASGIRGSLLRLLERMESDPVQTPPAQEQLRQLNEAGFAILVKAAQERMPPE